MICQNCKDGREKECWGLIKDKTWCDSQHYPKGTVILQAQFCKHLRASETYCPTCGSDFAPDRDSIPVATWTESEDPETIRDAADNFVVTGDDAVTGKPGQKRFSLDKLKTSRYSSGSNKEAPAS